MTRFGAVSTATNVDPWTREKDRLAALGVIAWSEPASSGGSGAPASGTIYGSAVYLYDGETVTNIHVCVQTAAVGTDPTLVKLGLWSSAATPVCLAVTADLKADAMWDTQGWKTAALSGAYGVTASGIYYPAFLKVGAWSGTDLALSIAGNSGIAGGPVGSNKRRWGSLKTSATDMAASDTGTYGTVGSVPLFGVS